MSRSAEWELRTDDETRDRLGDAYGEGVGDLSESGPNPDDEYLRRLYPEIECFARLMRREMWRNRRKGGRVLWRQCDTKGLVAEVYQHTGKLELAARRKDVELVAEHAADIGNCALHVADAFDLLD